MPNGRRKRDQVKEFAAAFEGWLKRRKDFEIVESKDPTTAWGGEHKFVVVDSEGAEITVWMDEFDPPGVGHRTTDRTAADERHRAVQRMDVARKALEKLAGNEIADEALAKLALMGE